MLLSTLRPGNPVSRTRTTVQHPGRTADPGSLSNIVRTFEISRSIAKIARMFDTVQEPAEVFEHVGRETTDFHVWSRENKPDKAGSGRTMAQTTQPDDATGGEVRRGRPKGSVTAKGTDAADGKGREKLSERQRRILDVIKDGIQFRGYRRASARSAMQSA